jgi:RHS repeat-associated protein
MLQMLSHDLAGSLQDVAFTYTRNQAQEIKTLNWSNDLYGWTGTADTRTFTANGLNQYTAVNSTPYGYDGNGNLTGDGSSTYAYDADNRLRTANASGIAATLNWDAGSRLRQTVIGATTTNLLYDGERLVAEYDVSGNLLRRYVHGSGIDEPLVKYEGAGTTSKSWYYADHLGSVVANADGAGTASATINYGPFGDAGSTTPGRFGYTGQQYFAPLGLYHYKARFYSPGLGRFLQTDPIGYGGGINLYSYVGGNPISRRDPRGRDNPGMGPYDAPAVGSSFTAQDVVNTVVGIGTAGAVLGGGYAGYVVAGTEVTSGAIGALIVSDAFASGAIAGLVISGAAGIVAVGTAVGGYYVYQYATQYFTNRTSSEPNPVPVTNRGTSESNPVPKP